MMDEDTEQGGAMDPVPSESLSLSLSSISLTRKTNNRGGNGRSNSGLSMFSASCFFRFLPYYLFSA